MKARLTLAGVALLAAIAGIALLVGSSSASTAKQSGSPNAAAGSVAFGSGFVDAANDTTRYTVTTSGKVKVVIAGTNDKEVTDGSLAGRGTFKASGAITDKGTALAYRTVKGIPGSAAGALITLRFVTKGKKGTITYVVKIDTKAATSRWTIASGTKAYKGLHGKGTESENFDFTVSTLGGTVSR